tara:strand:+ start:6671 stop:7351 length:681 start_codon:yes stop_codon:yes gene_type:complete
MSTCFIGRFKNELLRTARGWADADYRVGPVADYRVGPVADCFNISNYGNFNDFVDNKKYEQLKVYLSLTEFTDATKPDYLRLIIQYKIFNSDIVQLLCTHRINNLPMTFNNYILDYICDPAPGWIRSVWTGLRFVPVPRPYIYKNIDVQIKYPSDYPFKPPIYSLVDIETNASNKLYIKKFIESKILQHNECWSFYGNWSPGYGIMKEILCFIVALERLRNIINKF